MSHFHALACVFGNPIEQSKSPVIHGLFAKEFGIDLEYSKQLAKPDGFDAAANLFFENTRAIGANVTMPFKLAAYNWVDELSMQAKRAGAVNTIIRTPEGFTGDNTDGIGLVNDLLSHDVELKGAKVLLIGAGGAAKGAVPALVDAGIQTLYLYNRSSERAEALAEHINNFAPGLVSLYRDGDTHFDVVINATSLSLNNSLPELPVKIFKNHPAVYDMVYQAQTDTGSTVFLDHAIQHGCTKTIDGLGMLIGQAAHSFYLWFGQKPNTTKVFKHLRQLK